MVTAVGVVVRLSVVVAIVVCWCSTNVLALDDHYLLRVVVRLDKAKKFGPAELTQFVKTAPLPLTIWGKWREDVKFDFFSSSARLNCWLPLFCFCSAGLHTEKFNSIKDDEIIALLQLLRSHNCSLRFLDLSNCYHLSDEVLRHLPNTIDDLSLSYCSGITGKGLSMLPSTIKALDIAGKLSPLLVFFLSAVSVIRNLTFCSPFVTLCTFLTPGWFRSNEELKYLPCTLEKLNLWYCSCVNDQTLQYLPKTLTELNLCGCFNVTEEGLKCLPKTVKIVKWCVEWSVAIGRNEKRKM